MIKFNYKTYGSVENDAIIFVHGFIGSAEDWEEVISEFKDKYYCIAIDLPGHGSTLCDNDEEFEISKTNARLKTLIDRLGIKSPIVVAYSMGARYILDFAVNYPRYFSAMIIESGSCGLKSEQERKERVFNDYLLSQRIKDSDKLDFLEFWYSMPLFGEIKKHPEYKKLINNRAKSDKNGLIKSLDFAGTGKMASLHEQWKSLEIPCLLITGEKDEKYSAILKEMNVNNKFSEFKLIPNAAHNSHLENKEIFIKYVKDFLNKLL